MTMLHTACNLIVMWAIFDINQVTAKQSPPPPKPTQASQNEPDSNSSNSAVIGGSVGGCIALIIIVIVVVYCVWSRRRNRGQSDTKPNASMVFKNHSNNDVKQPRASEDKREPYSVLSNASENAAQRNVYDELGGVSNGNGTPTTNEEAEYCYISDSDIKAAQRQSGNPIPSVRNNMSLGDQTYSGQTGNQHISTSPVNGEPHEYLVLEPEHTSL
ncbi:uncharacterized protein LOC110454285 [Mizuhopecten yessoensis]|uniref:Uncharacterized protein n=1 Tax=Mizuhopecten yessoensis TaxID=6573 RepID=A0A210R4C2_MIZYE|nr:uncharacterized protein LOC110454285 [Mizuhopecten yessoensis]OWF55867.1 hypothetical protein KP79_PYT11647 [Mizuhopecten yessoensis]